MSDDAISLLTDAESARLMADLKRDEGWRAEPYECSANRLTVGFGTLLPFTPYEQAYIGQHRHLWPTPGQSLKDWDGRPHTVFPLNEAEGEYLLRWRAGHRVGSLSRLMAAQGTYYDQLPSDVRVALGNMAYQLGSSGVMRFRRMVSEIKQGHYRAAADEALDSLWAKQTSARAKRVAALIRGAA